MENGEGRRREEEGTEKEKEKNFKALTTVLQIPVGVLKVCSNACM